MVVKVYGPIRAACPQRVMVCLFEMELDFELMNVDLESGEYKKPESLLCQVRVNSLVYVFVSPCRD